MTIEMTCPTCGSHEISKKFIHDYNRHIRQKLAEQGDIVFSSSLH